MNNTLKAIKDRIEAVTGLDAFFQETTREKSYPYIVYNLPSETQLESFQRGMLEIDVWHNAKNRVGANLMAETIRTGMDRWKSISSTLGFRLLYKTTLSIPDPDENIIRKQVIFEVRDYKRRIG